MNNGKKEIIKGEVVEPKEKKELGLAKSDEYNTGLPAFPTKTQIKEYESFLVNYNSFIDSQLKDKTDYGIIPGVEKPSLFKPGAEKLEKLYFYRHEKINIEKIVRENYVKYTYRTIIYNKNGDIMATCEGTCNSREKKYRYHSIPEWEASDEIKKIVKAEPRKAKSGKTYNWYKVENTEVADLENTIMKMAQKRSYVGAILEATSSSGRFTQDVEDIVDFNGNKQQKPQDKLPTVEYGEYGEPIPPMVQKTAPNGIIVKKASPVSAPPVKPTYIGKCSDCGINITPAVSNYSINYHNGIELCQRCQLKYKKAK